MQPDCETPSLLPHREPWLSYGTIHRLWSETAKDASGQSRAGDHHYIAFAHAVGNLAVEQRTEDLRLSLIARLDELAGAFTRAAVERLVDEAFTHDARVRARRDASGG